MQTVTITRSPDTVVCLAVDLASGEAKSIVIDRMKIGRQEKAYVEKSEDEVSSEIYEFISQFDGPVIYE